MKNKFIIVLILHVLVSCELSKRRTPFHPLFDSITNNAIEYELDSAIAKKNTSLSIDTASFNAFWDTFSQNLKEDKKEDVIHVVNFPIHAIYFVYFKYAHDCDTISYIKDENRYYDIEITKKEALQYYDFMFSNVLKEIIFQTSADDILTKGINGRTKPGVVYSFFPKNYNVKVNCPNDHSLIFYISYENEHWSISVLGI